MRKISEFPSLLLSTICALGLMTCAGSAQLSGSLTNGLVGYWPLNGNGSDSLSTNNLSDVSPGASYGTNRFGASSSAIVFPNSSDYAYSERNTGISGNQNFTVSLWLNQFSSVTGPGRSVIAFGDASRPGGVNDILIMPQDWNGGGVWVWQHYAGIQANDLGNPFVGGWNNLVYVYDGSVSSSHIYINGLPAVMDNRTEVTTDVLDIVATPLRLGYWSNSTATQMGLDGWSLDDIGLWSRALSSTEVTDLYNAQAVPEPSTYALLLLSGAASLYALKRRKS